MGQEETYDAKEFGKRINRIRKKSKMTQSQLASLLGLSDESISNMEKGKTTCMPDHITRMCQIFKISADYFYFGTKEPFQSKDDWKAKEEKIYKVCNELKGCSENDLSKIIKIIDIVLDKH